MLPDYIQKRPIGNRYNFQCYELCMGWGIISSKEAAYQGFIAKVEGLAIYGKQLRANSPF